VKVVDIHGHFVAREELDLVKGTNLAGNVSNQPASLFLDAARFAADPASRPGFLIEAFDGGIGVTTKPGYEADVGPLTDILNAKEGLPIRPGDLVTASHVG